LLPQSQCQHPPATSESFDFVAEPFQQDSNKIKEQQGASCDQSLPAAANGIRRQDNMETETPSSNKCHLMNALRPSIMLLEFFFG
jgi:hypothetical protein